MLDLTWWQVFALTGGAIVSILAGRWLGGALHRVLYRHVLLTRSRSDDRYVLRLEGPFEAGGVVLVWQTFISLLALPPGALAFCRSLGHIGLLVALGFAAMRMVDTAVEQLSARSPLLADRRVNTALLPLVRRVVKIAVGTAVGVMILERMGYAIGPLLVLLGLVGGCMALASHRSVENVLAAYALVGDHGVREGDKITLDNGTSGVIEQIGLYSTRLRTTAASYVIVPNRKLADAQIERTTERSVQRPTTRPLSVVPPPRAANE
jgi:small-conductance mechanosensitive channel